MYTENIPLKRFVEAKVKRTTIFLALSQIAGLDRAVKADTAGLTVAHLIRQFIVEGLARQKRQQK